jgi:hypothetical protein
MLDFTGVKQNITVASIASTLCDREEIARVFIAYKSQQ